MTRDEALALNRGDKVYEAGDNADGTPIPYEVRDILTDETTGLVCVQATYMGEGACYLWNLNDLFTK